MLMMTKLFIILFVAMLMMMTKTLSSRSPLEIPTFPREESGKLLYWPYNHSMSYAWLLGSELGIHATILAMGRHATSFRPSRLSHRATFPALIFTPRYLHHCVLAQRHEKLRIMLQKVAKVVKYLWKIFICTAILNLYPLPSKCDNTVIFMSYICKSWFDENERRIWLAPLTHHSASSFFWQYFSATFLFGYAPMARWRDKRRELPGSSV